MIEEQHQSDWISLYDYLGKPAGGELGMRVYKRYKEEYPHYEPKVRQVSNRGYKGTVRLYPREWLDRYFQQYDRP